MKLRILISSIVLASFLIIRSTLGQSDSLGLIESDWEAFPILNYDTDVGLGYGGKGYFYNFFGKKESFDLTIYNSTKGERWYQVIYSIPDKQRRHGKTYDFALDITLDYDKWINLNFFSIENNDFDKSTSLTEKYTKEPIEISAIFSRAFTIALITELGLKYSSTSCYNMDPDGTLKPNALANTQHISLIVNLFYDSRTNLINPQRGILVQLSNEFAKDVVSDDQSFSRNAVSLQSYLPLFNSEIILASRIFFERMSKAMFPNKLALGGNNSIRGLPQDRYFSELYFLINEEIRFPIYWRIGGMVGLDAGSSSSTPNLILNPVIGLRIYLDNFIVRADLGFGNNTTGFYFNFGHLF
jgi:outer membrane protein assembly factor BamA